MTQMRLDCPKTLGKHCKTTYLTSQMLFDDAQLHNIQILHFLAEKRTTPHIHHILYCMTTYNIYGSC